MTGNYQKKRQQIGGIMLLCSVIASAVYNSYSHLFPDSPLKTYFPVIIALLIGTIGFYFIYKMSSKDQKFAIIVIPVTLTILLLFSLLS